MPFSTLSAAGFPEAHRMGIQSAARLRRKRAKNTTARIVIQEERRTERRKAGAYGDRSGLKHKGKSTGHAETDSAQSNTPLVSGNKIDRKYRFHLTTAHHSAIAVLSPVTSTYHSGPNAGRPLFADKTAHVVADPEAFKSFASHCGSLTAGCARTFRRMRSRAVWIADPGCSFTPQIAHAAGPSPPHPTAPSQPEAPPHSQEPLARPPPGFEPPSDT